VLEDQGRCFYDLAKYPQTLDFIVKAEQADMKTNKLGMTEKTVLLFFRADCHSRLGQHKQAFEYAHKAKSMRVLPISTTETFF
jgi:hypothetical protein